MNLIGLDSVLAARDRTARWAIRTPLVRLYVDIPDVEIYLELENLQPIGSFKIRGAANIILKACEHEKPVHIWTASAGNMAQGAAWCARELGIPCTVVVPDSAPETKLRAIERLGAKTVSVSVAEWFHVFETRRYPGMDGLFVHAFSDPDVMAGNGVIGLEVLEDLPDVDAIVAPYGGGGLSCGIASALLAAGAAPQVKVFGSEVDSAAPFSASWNAGKPVNVTYTPSFVDGIGAPRVYPEMFSLAQQVLTGPVSSSLSSVADAVRLLAERNRIVAEGAGASSVAAALAGMAGKGKVACVVSGGCINSPTLARLLDGWDGT